MENFLALVFGFLPVMLITVVLPAALVILLQVWLCKKGKWLGLILPGLILVSSLLITLSIAAFSMLTVPGGGEIQSYTQDEHGNLVQEEHRHIDTEASTAVSPASVLIPAAMIFLVSNIPTVVLGGIWLNYRNKSEWKEDLRKMNIQDLE